MAIFFLPVAEVLEATLYYEGSVICLREPQAAATKAIQAPKIAQAFLTRPFSPLS